MTTEHNHSDDVYRPPTCPACLSVEREMNPDYRPPRCDRDAYCFRPYGHFGGCTPEPTPATPPSESL